jgi:hypothetical protein
MTETVNEPQVDQDEQQAASSQAITIQDLNLLANIVDLASKRGAFQGSELSQVGAVYDKLSSFLNFVEAQQKAQAEAEEQSESEDSNSQE